MKKLFVFFLIAAFCVNSPAQETRARSATRRGEAAGYASRDASALSIMGWGLGIIIGIATLFSLLDNNSSHGGSHSH